MPIKLIYENVNKTVIESMSKTKFVPAIQRPTVAKKNQT